MSTLPYPPRNWARTDVLIEALHRLEPNLLTLSRDTTHAALPLSRVLSGSGLSYDSLFQRLLSDKHAAAALPFTPIAIDPSSFSSAGRLAHPGPVGSDFLPLWLQADQLVCVCHAPLLLPTREAGQALTKATGARALSVLYCREASFSAYAQVLLNHASLSAPLPPNWEPLPDPELCEPWVDLDGFQPEAGLAELIPTRFQRRFEVVPVFRMGSTFLTLATEHKPDLETRTEIAELLPPECTVRYVLADRVALQSALSGGVVTGVNMSQLALRLNSEAGASPRGGSVEQIDFRSIQQRSTSSDHSPAVTLLQTLLLHAVRTDASDLHLARSDAGFQVEYRLDDWKHPYPEPVPVAFYEPVLARLKVLAELDLQKQTAPQFGRFLLDVTNVGEVEVRVTLMPTVHGDSATLRFAHRRARFPSLTELGLGAHEAGILQRVIDGSHGLGLVVGPTGSGKSTTLYSLMAMIPADKFEVLSAEDPVERFLPGTKQTSIQNGLTYASYLAAALRADPDYIHIGETRTPDTAAQLLKAAETGHVVLSTLHTHEASATPARLFGLGVEPAVLAENLAGVVAQQLLPKLCPHCPEPVPAPSEAGLSALGIDPAWFGANPGFYEGRGCSHCRGRGAFGRLLIAEGFHVDATIHDLIQRRRPVGELREAQVRQGGRTLLQQAMQAAASGRVPLSVALSLGSGALS